MNVLVCGGAGYIGSHMVKALDTLGHRVVVLDNLSTGHREAVPAGMLVLADLLDAGQVDAVLANEKFDAVVHFAARSLVGESVRAPLEYYQNNVQGTLNLLEAMRRHGVTRIVFSSTAAVFGNPEAELIDEQHRREPINPYGASKLMVERVLADAASAYGLRSAALRYFNAAGADPSGEIGESHDPETHLIPNLCRAALGLSSGLSVYGSDYPTADGTCVRDYVHVNDLVSAHIAALDFLGENSGAHTFNLGNGSGFSVLDVIEAAQTISGRRIEYTVAERRPGDPPRLVASGRKARDILGWHPQFTTIESILETAWRWHSNPKF